VDPKTSIRDAQVQDLSDATYHGNTSTRVRAAEHKEAGQCDVIVVTAGAAQKEGEIFLLLCFCGFAISFVSITHISIVFELLCWYATAVVH
jgi:hypothetical protein